MWKPLAMAGVRRSILNTCRALALIVLAVPAVAAPVAPPPADVLAAPVTLAAKGEAIADVMSELHRQTGIAIRATRAIADRKVTILVDARPLREVIRGLTTAFGYRLSREDSTGRTVYTLWESPQARARRAGPARAEYRAAWEQIDAAVAERVRQPAQYPAGSLEALRSDYWAAMDDGHPPSQTLMDAAAERLIRRAYEVYATLDSAAREAIRTGCSVCMDTESPEEAWRLSRDITRDIDKLCDYVGTRSDDGLSLRGVNLRFQGREDEEQAALSITVTLRVFATDGETVVTGPVSNRLAAQARLDDRRQYLPQTDGKAWLSRKISISPAEIAREVGASERGEASASARVNRSDLLAAIHRKTGAQIIADHYSEYAAICPDPSEDPAWWASKPGHTLQEILIHCFPSALVGADDGFVYCVDEDPYASDLAETPNRILHPWRLAFADRGFLNLDELAAIAALGPRRADVITANAASMGLARRDTPMPWLPPTLRLYGLLTPRQRRAAATDGSRLADLTPAQVAALDDINISGMETVGDGPAVQAVRVGVYRGERRIDTPEPDARPASESALLRLGLRELEPSDDRWELDGAILPVTTSPGASKQEILAAIGAEHAATLARWREHTLSMTLSIGDGPERCEEFSFHERIPFTEQALSGRLP